MAGVWRLFLARPESVSAARQALEQLDEVDPPTRNVVQLLASELVTNAIRHGSRDPHESILLSAQRVDSAVHVEVCDEGHAGFDRAPQPGDPLEPGGNGFVLIDALAARWGVRAGQPTCVWFEADSSGTAGALDQRRSA